MEPTGLHFLSSSMIMVLIYRGLLSIEEAQEITELIEEAKNNPQKRDLEEFNERVYEVLKKYDKGEEK